LGVRVLPRTVGTSADSTSLRDRYANPASKPTPRGGTVSSWYTCVRSVAPPRHLPGRSIQTPPKAALGEQLTRSTAPLLIAAPHRTPGGSRRPGPAHCPRRPRRVRIAVESTELARWQGKGRVHFGASDPTPKLSYLAFRPPYKSFDAARRQLELLPVWWTPSLECFMGSEGSVGAATVQSGI
jgi:hypothetical protein